MINRASCQHSHLNYWIYGRSIMRRNNECKKRNIRTNTNVISFFLFINKIRPLDFSCIVTYNQYICHSCSRAQLSRPFSAIFKRRKFLFYSSCTLNLRCYKCIFRPHLDIYGVLQSGTFTYRIVLLCSIPHTMFHVS